MMELQLNILCMSDHPYFQKDTELQEGTQKAIWIIRKNMIPQWNK